MYEWRRRFNADEEQRSMRTQEAATAVQRRAHLLYENYGACKVYLFGSLNKPETFHDRSDINLVVDGLPPRLDFKALAELWRLLPQRWN